MMNEFHAALQNLYDAINDPDVDYYNTLPLQVAIDSAKALLARSEPASSARLWGAWSDELGYFDNSIGMHQQRHLVEARTARVLESDQAVKDLRVVPVYVGSEPEPRITREEVQGVDFGESKEWMMDTAANKRTHAEKLLQRFAAQCIAVQGNGSLEALHAAKEACLAAMLRSEPSQSQPVAWVPVHPRLGPQWASTIGSLDSDHPKNYALMPLYAAAAEKAQIRAQRDELLKALCDLSFSCFAGIGLQRPSTEVYNETLLVLQRIGNQVKEEVIPSPPAASDGEQP